VANKVTVESLRKPGKRKDVSERDARILVATKKFRRVEQDEAPEAPAGPDATEAAVTLAGEHGLDLAQIKGTGAGGRITVGDVRSAVPAEPEPAEAEPGPTEQKGAGRYSRRDMQAEDSG
jgi:pyruvate/2-oxoglutarate dehydrogenase complex dihydrolipoamide acyltransferase (E2) component